MKVLKALLAALIVSFSGNAQIVALNPTAEGGFELGSSFSANGWVEVTPPTNRWIVSTTAPYSGSRVAFVSNGTANTYTFTSAQTCHIYRDVTIPSGSVSINLSFYWRSTGQIGADRLLVYTAPVSVTPIVNVPVAPATTLAASATLVWTQTATSAGYTLATVPLPSSLSGTTFRLIFTWQNDAATGANPPAAVDSVAVTYNCAYPDPIAGVTTVCEGGTSVLGSASPGGTWVSSNPSVATVSASGNITASVQGTTTISYTTGCANPATTVVTVIAAPSPISGPSAVCEGASITLTDTGWGGGWTSSAPSYASINSITGVVTGLVPGIATMTYANGCGSPVTKTITVNPIPAAITGGDTVCEGGGTLTLSSASVGGTWSSLSTSNATVGSSSGVVTGVSDGTVSIVYTNSFGCFVSKMVTVSAIPSPITGIAPFCVGSNITLSSTFPGGTWNSAMPGIAMISSSGVVTGLAAGFTTISYSNGCGPTTAVVSVDALPATITGFDTVCIGSTTTFANSVLGGTWTSGNPSVATVLPTSGIITGVSTGVSVIYYTMPGGCFISRIVYVVDVPGPISGPTDVCPGNFITLSNSTPGGTWTSYAPGSASINPTTGVLTGINPDIVSIGYTTPAGCVAYTSVTVNPVPSPIIGGVKYCATDVDTLFNASPGGTWTSVTPGVASIGNSTGIMTTLAGGTAIIRYTLTSTGCSTIKSFTVNALPVPAVNFVWATNTFETGTWYVSYQWYHSVFGKLPGATLYKVAGAFNGNYSVEVTDTNGCTNRSTPVPYATWMGVGSMQGQPVYSVFPNPATDVLFIDADQTVNAMISTIDGKVLLEEQNARKIDIAALPSGLYMLTLYNSDGIKVAVEKFTKQ
jgi:uncharacterized protein YjdB